MWILDIGHLLFAWNAGSRGPNGFGAERAASLARGARRCQRRATAAVFRCGMPATALAFRGRAQTFRKGHWRLV